MSIFDLIGEAHFDVVQSPIAAPTLLADNATQSDSAPPHRVSCMVTIDQSEELECFELDLLNCDNLIDCLN